MVEKANKIWADGPSSAPFEPFKPDIRAWGTWIESIIGAFFSTGGKIYQTRALLNADLTPAANSIAWVMEDPTVANNGIYRKVGGTGTGSWVRAGDLPFSFIVASNPGAGTPNAIQATTSIPVSSSALVILPIAATNTASPVTVSFNGGPALAIKTVSGDDVVPGGLTGGMVALGIVAGSTFRLTTDQASTAILDLAQAAAEAALAAANAGFVFDNLEDFREANIPSALGFIRTAGYYAPGDGGGAMYVRMSSSPNPEKPWHKQSADGAWWIVRTDVVVPEVLGAKGDGIRDDHVECQAALEFGLRVRFNAGKTYLLSKGLGIPTNRTVFIEGSTLQLADTAGVYENVLSNWNRWTKQNITLSGGSPGTTYDVFEDFISIVGVGFLNCRGAQRTVGLTKPEYDTYGGCGIKLAGCRFSSVDGAVINNPIMHGVAIDPFGLANNFNTGHNGYNLIDGRSQHVSQRNVIVYNSIVDDGITLHAAKHVSISHCKTIMQDANQAAMYENQVGIEVDGGCEYVHVDDCYSYGYASGFGAVGHYNEPPARNVTFSRCVAEGAYRSFWAWNNPGGGDTGNPNYIPMADRAKLTQARGVTFRDCTAINMKQIVDRVDGGKKLMPLWVAGYADVLVDGLTVIGIDPASKSDCYIQIENKGYNVRLKNLAFKDCASDVKTNPLIIVPNTDAQQGFEVDGVSIGICDGHNYVVADNAAAATSIRNIVVNSQTGLTASVLSTSLLCEFDNIRVPGAVAKRRNSAGGLTDFKMSDLQGYTFADVYTPTATAVANVSSVVTSAAQYQRVGNIVTVSGRLNITPSASGMVELYISLPIASAVSAGNLAGTISGIRSTVIESGGIYADAGTARMRFNTTATSAGNYPFTFTYLVL